MLRILLVATLLAAALLAVKEGRVLQRAGLVGSCSTVASPPGESGEWRACRSGRISGRPDLSRDSCTAEGVYGGLQFWRCPAPLVSSPTRQ